LEEILTFVVPPAKYARNCQSFRHQSLHESLLKPQRITPALNCKDHESEVNAAGITQNERNRRKELQSIRKRLAK